MNWLLLLGSHTPIRAYMVVTYRHVATCVAASLAVDHLHLETCLVCITNCN
jgi:hypothetical protein